MKKIKKSGNPPARLSEYLLVNPNNEWRQFKGNDRDGDAQIKSSITQDQRGLCAYCEIDLAPGRNAGLDDFRVEHFHPKKPHAPPPNHSLDWSNMLGVCTGGNAKDVAIRERFTPAPDHSCDVPKGNHNWTGLILNPLVDIPAFPNLFRYHDATGEMFVDETNCPLPLLEKAANSIEKLRLSLPADGKSRLNRFRVATLNGLRERLLISESAGLTVAEALEEMAEEFFSDDVTKPWPAFFSCVRWYFGQAAEERLRLINYDG